MGWFWFTKGVNFVENQRSKVIRSGKVKCQLEYIKKTYTVPFSDEQVFLSPYIHGFCKILLGKVLLDVTLGNLNK